MNPLVLLLAAFIGWARPFVHHGDVIGHTAFFSYMALAHIFVAYLWFGLIGGGLQPILKPVRWMRSLFTKEFLPLHEWHIDALIAFWVLVSIELICSVWLKI